jgi:hypothetical protein
LPSKNLVRRASGQPLQPPVFVVDQPTPGPYSPRSISLYGRGDGTYYTKEKRCQEAERKSFFPLARSIIVMTFVLSESDDEFGTTIHGVPYPQPIVYQYPDAHPDLENFPRSELKVEPAALRRMKEREKNMASSDEE